MLGKNEKAKVTTPKIFRNFLRSSMVIPLLKLSTDVTDWSTDVTDWSTDVTD
ncbi:MAG: hypothetical protein ACE5K2_00180 [Candidatus Zixiibacteriota bacterium]